MNKNSFIYVLLIFGLLVVSCESQPNVLVVMAHDSFSISEEIISQFEETHGIEVVFLPSGDAGSTLNRAILAKEAPVADILYGIDNTFLSRALEEDIFEIYSAPLLAEVPEKLKLDPEDHVVPVDYGDVCINYDKQYFADHGLTPPMSLDDLLDPSYYTLLVVENPATSSPGLAFLLSTIAEYGENGYIEYWKDLRNNGVVVVNDWETAYYTNFSGSVGRGAQPMVVSYGTSPAAEVIFSEESISESPTASLVGENMCFRQIEFAGILKGTRNRKLAEKFIDHMLGGDFQSDIPMNMFVFPANENADIPREFLDHIQVPDQPAVLDLAEISENRELWIEAWRELMLQ